MTEPIWTPSRERVENANMTAFLRQVAKSQPQIVDFPALYRWSIDHPELFWRQVWDFCGVLSSQPASEVVRGLDRMPGTRWFPGARLNFAENLLRFRDDRPAIVFWNENGRQAELTYAELATQVARLAAALRHHGIGEGDRVAGFLPNLPQAIVAMLATASLGAIWSSCSPDFGVKGVLDRFGQIEPRVLFVADGYLYNGKSYGSLERVAQILQTIDAIERVVVMPYQSPAPDLSFSDRAVSWSDFVADADSELTFAQLPFDHPLYVMYSSGTTGLPKCMVHGAGGTLIQHLKELVLHTDVGRDDRIFYFTTCGWMMWNWLVSSLAAGATVVLYDGSPLSPRADFLWQMAAAERLTIFGTSAKYLALIEKEGVRPGQRHDLAALRTVLSTGSPLMAESFDYVYRDIKAGVCLSSISGGTDLISCFALGNPIQPVYRGELQTRGLGMKVEIFDAEGRSVIGEQGELVCTLPFPSMPIGFWNDADGSRYHQAYFDTFPGVWRHGDWAQLSERGTLVISGRSDATLNPGGVRIGTAEIYRQVEQLDEVIESLVIGQEWQGDVRVVLFVRLRPGTELDETLADRIRRHLRVQASPHHVPKKIIAVDDLPRTLSGKISELAVREIIHGRPVKNAEALANPDALDLYRNLPQLAD